MNKELENHLKVGDTISFIAMPNSRDPRTWTKKKLVISRMSRYGAYSTNDFACFNTYLTNDTYGKSLYISPVSNISGIVYKVNGVNVGKYNKTFIKHKNLLEEFSISKLGKSICDAFPSKHPDFREWLEYNETQDNEHQGCFFFGKHSFDCNKILEELKQVGFSYEVVVKYFEFFDDFPVSTIEEIKKLSFLKERNFIDYCYETLRKDYLNKTLLDTFSCLK